MNELELRYLIPEHSNLIPDTIPHPKQYQRNRSNSKLSGSTSLRPPSNKNSTYSHVKKRFIANFLLQTHHLQVQLINEHTYNAMFSGTGTQI